MRPGRGGAGDDGWAWACAAHWAPRESGAQVRGRGPLPRAPCLGWGAHKMGGGVPPLANTGRSREGRSGPGTGARLRGGEGHPRSLLGLGPKGGRAPPFPWSGVSRSPPQRQGQAVTSLGRSLTLSYGPQFRPGFELRMDGRRRWGMSCEPGRVGVDVRPGWGQATGFSGPDPEEQPCWGKPRRHLAQRVYPTRSPAR